MATSPEQRLLTAEEFLQIDFGPDIKAELDDGILRMMAGGTRAHARVQMNLYRFLGEKLRGTSCRPYGSDMAVRAHDRSIRYPDVSVDCGGPGDRSDDKVLSDPRLVIEVLSDSTRHHDLRVKKEEYRELASVATIAFVDPDAETVSVLQRIEDGWTESAFSATLDIAVPSLNLVIPRTEIFARD